MSFVPIKQLKVWRRLSGGDRCLVGILAQNRQGVFFQYDADYLQDYSSLSPYRLAFNGALQAAPLEPHRGLHGVFADSIPDGWGLLLMDRVFRQAHILPSQITAMDRLAFVGHSAMGALCYEPASDFVQDASEEAVNIGELGLQAQALYEGETQEVLAALVNGGSSGGARPKVQVYFDPSDPEHCSMSPRADYHAWLVKFTSAQLALGHEESLCEAAYLTLAAKAGISVPHWCLLNAPIKSGARQWLALQRFDTVGPARQKQEGRLHLHSACGLLDADFRQPSLDYEDLIKASSQLCKSVAVGQELFRRAMFNLFAVNQDDHSKNWAFLQDDTGEWSLAPFFDITFSPAPHREHATAYAGYGKNPPLKVVQGLAIQAGFADWRQARTVVEEVVETLSEFGKVARGLEVADSTVRLLERELNGMYENNKGLVRES